MADDLRIETRILGPEEKKTQPSMAVFMAVVTDHGRFKCPQCGRFAKMDELGSIGGTLYDAAGKWAGHISAYGHLPGFGCNTKVSD